MKIEKIGNGLKHHITVNAKTLQRFNHILDSKYNLEFTAFTHCKRNNDTGEYLLYDLFIPNQVNTATTTELESDDIIELIQDGADISKLSGHIHSHVNMGVFASGTDKKDIIERSEHSNYNAALILNKKGEMFGHIVDLDLGLYLEDVDIYIQYPHSTNFEQRLLAQIKKAKSLEEVIKLTKIDEWEWYNATYPLTKEETEQLDNWVKTRFKTTHYPNNNFKKKETKSITAQYHQKTWWEDDDYDESQWSNYKPQQLIEDEIDDALILEGYDESKFASVDDYLDYLMTVSEQSMTTKEFNDYEYHILGIRY